MFYAYAIIGHTRANQLLPQLLIEQFDTLPIQCRHILMEQFDTLPIQWKHIEHVHDGVWFRKNNFWQNDSSDNLDNFSLIGLLYMHRWCLHRPINSYHSFYGAIWYISYTMKTHWTCAWRSLVQKK